MLVRCVALGCVCSMVTVLWVMCGWLCGLWVAPPGVACAQQQFAYMKCVAAAVVGLGVTTAA